MSEAITGTMAVTLLTFRRYAWGRVDLLSIAQYRRVHHPLTSHPRTLRQINHQLWFESDQTPVLLTPRCIQRRMSALLQRYEQSTAIVPPAASRPAVIANISSTRLGQMGRLWPTRAAACCSAYPPLTPDAQTWLSSLYGRCR